MYFDTILVIDNICYGDTNGAITISNFNGGVLPLSLHGQMVLQIS